jgi:hypothetical protein
MTDEHTPAGDLALTAEFPGAAGFASTAAVMAGRFAESAGFPPDTGADVRKAVEAAFVQAVERRAGDPVASVGMSLSSTSASLDVTLAIGSVSLLRFSRRRSA